jgi:surface carbohydrate biosynthesis protein
LFFHSGPSSAKVGRVTLVGPREFQGEGPFWTMNPEPDSFVRILDYLFEIDNVQWCKDIEAVNFSSYVLYTLGNTILKSTLKKILGEPPALAE